MKYRTFIGGRLLSHRIELPYILKAGDLYISSVHEIQWVRFVVGCYIYLRGDPGMVIVWAASASISPVTRHSLNWSTSHECAASCR